MNAGQLDTRISIQKVTTAVNDSGDPVESVEPLSTVWSSMKFLKGRELIEAKEIYDEVECLFTIRYSSDVAETSAKHQVTAKGEVFNIIGDPIPVPGGRPTKLLIYTKRHQNGSY